MFRLISIAFLLFVCFPLPRAFGAEPVRLILDTDIGNDVDDALALAMIHALQNRAEVRLLAVTITKDNRFAAPFVDLVDTFYGRSDIPIGVVHKGKTRQDSPMLEVPDQRRDSSGHYVYPHRLEDGSQAPEAVELLTRILSDQPDHSVTIAQIGFSTNLARLLKAPGGRDLVLRKVRLLCLMAGNFEKPEPEYNIYTDPDSAKFLLQQWPTPMIFSGFEVGLVVTFPYQSIEKDFAYTDNHPIAEAYHLYVQKPEDHPAWDPTAVLEAIRPDRGYFDLSGPGDVSLGPKNTTVFTPNPQGKCRYLICKPDQVGRVRELIATLASEPPMLSSSSVNAHRMIF
ncbi:MAG: nucleoside hydrolase [Acidobacteriaceae bacterium]|nr:nucleoside hydrolase [Acidobacteriaceae bacterium]MBV9295652.1 nucleoside hydrolase [Acidobacteriaceae bacterium]